MAIVRQLPELYLRGALANVTMKNLTPEQQKEAEELTNRIAHHPEMIKHKSHVIHQYRSTFRNDYLDSGAAEQEYLIAIFKGVISLLHHHEYTYQCTACQSTTYLTKRGKPSPIDRVQSPCPNCKKVMVTHQGDTDLQIGQFVTPEEFQAAYIHHSDHDEAPKYESTIIPIQGEKKHKEPDKILSDPAQISKYFGEFVWNYFKQQIAENDLTTHKKTTTTIHGLASQIYCDSLSSIMREHKIHHNTIVETRDGLTCHILSLNFPTTRSSKPRKSGLELPLEVTILINEVIQTARACNANVQVTNTEIIFTGGGEATTQKVVKDRVAVLSSGVAIGNDGESAINLVSYRSIRGNKMDQEDHVSSVDAMDAVNRVRNALPSGHHQDTFDIIRQHGDIYTRFSSAYGDGPAKMNHIAEFLGINTKNVNDIMSKIRWQCIANDFVPN